MRIRLASTNQGKLKEVAAIFGQVGVEVIGPPSDWVPPEETGDSYLQNAMLKAVSLLAHTGEPSLADDSGIEVDALAGRPGVRSARFAGEGATDRDNLARMIEVVEETALNERGARYRCVAVLADLEGEIRQGLGTLEGTLIEDPRGENGFGYDPIFVPKGESRTAAELLPEEKDSISHRGLAFRQLISAVKGAVARASIRS